MSGFPVFNYGPEEQAIIQEIGNLNGLISSTYARLEAAEAEKKNLLAALSAAHAKLQSVRKAYRDAHPKEVLEYTLAVERYSREVQEAAADDLIDTLEDVIEKLRKKYNEKEARLAKLEKRKPNLVP